jgi:hypothetical protein
MTPDEQVRDVCAELGELIYRLSSSVRQHTLEYSRLLSVLDGICRGEIEPGRVQVDLAGLTWVVAPEEKSADADQGAD